MSENLYTYTQQGILQNPNHYMYTPFQGEEFLNAYESDRTNFINAILESLDKEISPILSNQGQLLLPILSRLPSELKFLQSKISFSEEQFWPLDEAWLERILNEGEAKTEQILAHLLGARERSRAESLNPYDIIIEKMRRNFETKRRVYDHYKKGLRQGVGQGSLSLYVKLSLLFALHLRAPDDLKTLNVLLKINDIVISEVTNIANREDLVSALIAVGLELNWIRKLRYRESV